VGAWFKRLSDVTLVLAGLFLFAMMLHVTADVALKYLINSPVPGTLEIVSAYYMVGGVFLPIAAVELTRTNIGVDVAYQALPRRLKVLCMAIVLVSCAIVYLTLAWTSWDDAMKSFAIREVMMGSVLVVVWPSRLVLPISLLIGASVCLYYLYGLLTSDAIRERLISTDVAAEEA